MKNKILSFALVCAITFSFASCKDAEADAKEAASAVCKRRELEKSLVKSETNRKAITALTDKVIKIQKRHYNKTSRKLDPKFSEAFEKYKMECK